MAMLVASGPTFVSGWEGEAFSRLNTQGLWLQGRHMTINGLSDSLAQPYIKDAIYKGLFTPFLGAGASSLRPSRADLATHPWDEIMRTLISIAAHLQTEQ